VPVQALSFVPGGIIEDKNIPFSGGGDRLCRFIKKDLKDIGIAVARLPGSGAFYSPTPPGLRFALYARFISVPQVHVGIFNKTLQFLLKLLSLSLILSIGPGLRYLEPIALLMEKAQQRCLRTFNLNMTVKGCGGPEGPLSTTRLFKFINDLFLLFSSNTWCLSGTLLRNQTVNPKGIEGPDNLLYRTLTHIKGTHDLVSRTACQEHDNHKTATIGLLIARTHGSLHICQGCILGIGSEKGSCHCL